MQQNLEMAQWWLKGPVTDYETHRTKATKIRKWLWHVSPSCEALHVFPQRHGDAWWCQQTVLSFKVSEPITVPFIKHCLRPYYSWSPSEAPSQAKEKNVKQWKSEKSAGGLHRVADGPQRQMSGGERWSLGIRRARPWAFAGPVFGPGKGCSTSLGLHFLICKME